jgi:hypothetical protein
MGRVKVGLVAEPVKSPQASDQEGQRLQQIGDGGEGT